MTRYFDPICGEIHLLKDLPKCPTHGVNFSRHCVGCQAVAGKTPCGAGSEQP